MLFVAGSVDDVSGYAKGTRALFEGVVNADRYLLTFINANHNAAAPHPAPTETLGATGRSVVAFTHYADAVWDTVRMNNILQHFATAYFDRHLKGDDAKQAYFDVVASGNDAVYAVDREGRELPAHTYWKGFKRGTADRPHARARDSRARRKVTGGGSDQDVTRLAVNSLGGASPPSRVVVNLISLPETLPL